MTMPKKGTRKITVDGVDYRWVVRRKIQNGSEEDEVSSAVVERFDCPKGSVLTIIFPWARYDSIYSNFARPITPKHVALSIQKSLLEGWQPENSGPTFLYSFSEQA